MVPSFSKIPELVIRIAELHHKWCTINGTTEVLLFYNYSGDLITL